VIAKVTRGGGPGGAVRYLFSAGRHNEHEDPHVVAAAAVFSVEGSWPGTSRSARAAITSAPGIKVLWRGWR
jgi:hypothetical protein